MSTTHTTITHQLSPVDVANTILKEAFRARLVITQKQLFAAVMELHQMHPDIFSEYDIVRVPRALYGKFMHLAPGPVTDYIPIAGGAFYFVTALNADARQVLGLDPRRPASAPR